ncbi:FMN-binding glutamate synthase family protein [Galactobacter valiniphilus]|uniref:FMN-binding glutamate synthase family protein n=1 Tax=Galactobacter valiniphilus TaxID=2676122 RepID=A0A399JA44_9MICC|nr:FMN-binding glutamate synthase family protein [Galactobacter valiniphilus]RII42471.1 FMN-binding glutamate synthase family protein [Galactobacter valiniphilus]
MGTKTKAALGLMAAGGAALGGVAIHDLTQKKRAVLRNFPVIGHARYLLEGIRPMIQQYFIERDWDGRPFNKTTRQVIEDRSEGTKSEESFGTLRDVGRPGYEWLVHSMAPLEPPELEPRVMVGGPECTQPYSISLMNVSAMSFGALSANAIQALNEGAAAGGFAHDTGEGGLSDHHRHGGDLIWEIGTGYFGARTADGHFDPEKFRAKAADPQVKMVSLKLSQGAKPGLGGVLPGAKVTAEIARIRDVPEGQNCISPAQHSVFDTPRELIEFIRDMRVLAGGKPTGFKLCVTSKRDVLAICKAMLEVGSAPDFIIIDGSEGGTGAAPSEFEDHVGMPLTQGLMLFHNALVGAGLRDRIKLGASGKVAEGNDIVKRLIQGADFTNSARAMMMALGCIQSLKCSTDTCPAGVATQDPRRQKALDVPSKAQRVTRYHRATVDQALRLIASMGVRSAADLTPEMLRRNIEVDSNASYAELYRWLKPGELLTEPPEGWERDWRKASPDHFGFKGALH